ncbi:hypothetical protein D3C73_1310780 [compost metagenome]
MASVFVSSVLPTPVGPKSINEPIGLFSSFNPTLALFIALAKDSTASSCPITLCFNALSKFFNLFDSSSDNLLTGIFVHLDTTSQTSCSVTLIS